MERKFTFKKSNLKKDEETSSNELKASAKLFDSNQSLIKKKDNSNDSSNLKQKFSQSVLNFKKSIINTSQNDENKFNAYAESTEKDEFENDWNIPSQKTVPTFNKSLSTIKPIMYVLKFFIFKNEFYF